MKRIALLALAAAVCLLPVSGLNISANAAQTSENSGNVNNNQYIQPTECSYENYINEYSEADCPSENITISLDRFTASGNADCSISTAAESINALSWVGTGKVSWEFSVHEEGFYRFEMNYFSQSENNSSVSLGIDIDGEYPFEEAREVSFDRYWKNKTSIRLDKDHKNQILPEIVRYNCNMTAFAENGNVSDEPLKFYLSEGEHTLTLHGVYTDFFIGSLRFCGDADKTADSYSAIRPSLQQLEATPALIDGVSILTEAEMPKYTNSALLRPVSETSDYAISPSHPTNVRYNVIGTDSWNTAGQTVFYEVTAPSEGYYALNIKCRLNTGSGIQADRRIRINGSVLCSELNDVEIPFSQDWQTVSPKTDAGELIYIHLRAGKNVISFEAINGEAGTALKTLGRLVYDMQCSTDDGSISGKFADYGQELLAAKDGLESAAGGKIDDHEIEVLINLLKKYDKSAPENFDDLSKCLNSASAWVESNEKRSVEMDYFELKTVHEEFRSISRDFFKQLSFGFQRFWGSFFGDYNANSENSDSLALNIVSNEENAKIINNLTGNYEDEISVSVNSQSLLELALSGNTPDVALFVDKEEVYELASRGLLADLSVFIGYDEVSVRSPAGVSKLYEYEGKVYGIPLTNSFPMMFYRSDILEKLGLSVPKTWDELEEILPVLNENGLTAGLGSPSDFSSDNMLLTMLCQTGTSLSDFSDIKSAFSRYAEFYTKYSCPSEYDALRLFKTGKMPIVIADYSEFYAKLSDAGEIRGLWNITNVPGTVVTNSGETTVADSSVNADTYGAVIFADSKNASKAWEFISWFTQAEVQTKFGVMKEALSDEIYASADINVISALRQSDYRRIARQASNVNGIQTLPNGFKRGVYSAFVETIDGKCSANEAIEKYAKSVNIQNQK